MLAFTSVYFSESGLFNGLQPVQIRKSSELKLSISHVLSGNNRTPRLRASRSDAKHRVSKASPPRNLVPASLNTSSTGSGNPTRTASLRLEVRGRLKLSRNCSVSRPISSILGRQLVSHCLASRVHGDLQFISRISDCANMSLLILISGRRTAYLTIGRRSARFSCRGVGWPHPCKA